MPDAKGGLRDLRHASGRSPARPARAFFLVRSCDSPSEKPPAGWQTVGDEGARQIRSRALQCIREGVNSQHDK